MMKNLFTLLSLAILSVGCSSSDKMHTIQGRAQGTTFTLRYIAKEKNPNLNKQVTQLFLDVDASLSTYKKDSYISKWNRNEDLQERDSLFLTMYQQSRKVHRETGKYFDPTIGPLSAWYGFQDKENKDSLPQIMEYIGLDLVYDSLGFVLKKHPKVQLNYNAIAQGFAVDLLKELFEKEGYSNFLIEVGGELYCSGKKPNNEAWKIAIDKPEADRDGNFYSIQEVENQAVATSGNYRKWRKNPVNEEKWVHTINPITGKSSPTDVLSITVFHNQCSLADAYATAILAMGKEKGQAVIDSLELKTFVIGDHK
jgi:thiamine biosynthesis lipoprotein